MGNVQGSTLTRTSGALDSYVSELSGDIVYERSLGSARFLKTVKCRHRNGYLVIKIFIKPDPGLTLRSYIRRLKSEKESLQDMSNVYTFQSFLETEKAGYLIRQWIASSLYDRISTRPFLSPIEKKWITYQLLNAMRDCRSRKVSHGDIKSENILVTSWNWVYLTDFASYKPTYLPLDDPADFSFFFDTSGRRTCYIAPERFYTAESNPDISAKKNRIAMEESSAKRDGKVTEAMDCFSVGCVIAELFLEGAPLFTLSQLFKYREGEYSVEGPLNAIEDADVRSMIKQMISLEPSARPSFDSLLHTSRGTVFPESFFMFFHNYVSSVNESSVAAALQSPTSSTITATTVPAPTASSMRPSAAHSDTAGSGQATEPSKDLLPSDSDHRIEKIWADFDSVEPYLTPDTLEDTVMDVKVDYASSSSVSKPFQDVIPVELCIPNRESKLQGPWSGRTKAAKEDGPGLIILALVTANLRNCSLPSSKIRALDVFLALCPHLTDEAKLDRMIPYIVDLLHDEAAIVRASALRTLTQVLLLVTVITPSNFTIFPEYILPNLRHLVTDPDTSVRCTHAQCIVHLADTAVRYLEMGQALKAHGALVSENQDSEANHLEFSYDAAMQDLQNTIQEHLSTFLVDGSSVVKRAVLHDISSMCIFLGKQKTNDVILSHMITYLNDRDWLLRHAFFESIVDVAACAGGRSLEEYIYPLMTQALSDAEETVVARVLSALTSLCELGLFQKMRIWEIISQTLHFLYHPNVWIRQGAASLISSTVKQLPTSDVWCIVYPSLRYYLTSEVAAIDETSLLASLKSPLLRSVFDGAVQWAKSGDKTVFWKNPRRSSSKSDSPRDSVVALRKGGSSSSRSRTEEDEAHLDKLKQVGMTSPDEAKLLAMRDYITKLAGALSSFASRMIYEVEAERNLRTTNYVELTKLGVVPQTVFLKSKTDGSRTSRLQRPLSSVTDLSLRALGSPRRASRTSSDNGAAFEDLRRRLATINSSVSSLQVAHSSREGRSLGSPLATNSIAFHEIALAPEHTERPLSPSESVVSTATSSIQPSARLHIGSTDGQKAAPAIGSSKASATGLLDAHLKVHSDDSNPSGRSSPLLAQHSHGAMYHPGSAVSHAISTYDGQEAGITTVLENMYLEDQQELQQDFGPSVHEGPVRRRNAVRHGFAPRDGTPRQTEAALIAHLASHSDAITCLAVAPDHAFFVSGSDDKTVKVWDTARLERNVTAKPRHTYNQHHAKVKALCILEGVHCFASAANDGSLHIVRIHLTQGASLPKYGKLQVIREHRVGNPGEYITCMVHFNQDASSTLIYATTHSSISLLDVRSMRVTQTMENPRHYGPITCLCLDRKRSWFIVGTSTGVLTLWDRRFGLLLKSWHVGVASTGRAVRIHQVSIHPTRGKGKWVLVAVETTAPSSASSSTRNLIEVWDIERSVLVETFVSRNNDSEPTTEPYELTGVDADRSPHHAIAALVRSRQATGGGKQRISAGFTLSDPSLNVRTMVAGTDFGSHSSHRHERNDLAGSSRSSSRPFIISGSEDRKIRYWDLSRLERSAIVSGLESELERPTYKSETTSSAATHIEICPPPSGHSNRAPQRMSLVAHNQQNLLKSHQDVITSMACINSPFRGGLVTGDRAGVIKVWRIDLGD